MKKLKNKVFFTILIIFTSFLLSIFVFFQYQDYHQEKLNIENSIQRMTNMLEKDFKNQFSRPDSFPFDEMKPNDSIWNTEEGNNPKIFMDSMIYSILLNNQNEIIDIISHHENTFTEDEIRILAESIIKKETLNSLHIGNLYFERYSYSYQINHHILLIDNTNVNNRLISSLKTSLLLFVILELIIFVISSLLTKWIIRPVLETFEKQKQFIADASHELKTPLSVIMASADALESDLTEKKWLSNIQSESERMSKLISDLLNLARIEDEKQKMEYVVCSLSKIVEKAVLTLESLIFEKNISLEYHIEENIQFECHQDYISRLVMILLDNAIQHSVENGKIIVDLFLEKDDIVLSISNKGEAIPKGEEEKIFERFYRSDKSRNRDENRYGLGLAIAKTIILNHHGKIVAYSKADYTTFKVNFKRK